MHVVHMQNYYSNKHLKLRAGEMVQWLRVHSVLGNQSSRRSNAFLRCPQALYSPVYTTHKKKIQTKSSLLLAKLQIFPDFSPGKEDTNAFLCLSFPQPPSLLTCRDLRTFLKSELAVSFLVLECPALWHVLLCVSHVLEFSPTSACILGCEHTVRY